MHYLADALEYVDSALEESCVEARHAQVNASKMTWAVRPTFATCLTIRIFRWGTLKHDIVLICSSNGQWLSEDIWRNIRNIFLHARKQ